MTEQTPADEPATQVLERIAKKYKIGQTHQVAMLEAYFTMRELYQSIDFADFAERWAGWKKSQYEQRPEKAIATFRHKDKCGWKAKELAAWLSVYLDLVDYNDACGAMSPRLHEFFEKVARPGMPPQPEEPPQPPAGSGEATEDSDHPQAPLPFDGEDEDDEPAAGGSASAPPPVADVPPPSAEAPPMPASPLPPVSPQPAASTPEAVPAGQQAVNWGVGQRALIPLGGDDVLVGVVEEVTPTGITFLSDDGERLYDCRPERLQPSDMPMDGVYTIAGAAEVVTMVLPRDKYDDYQRFLNGEGHADIVRDGDYLDRLFESFKNADRVFLTLMQGGSEHGQYVLVDFYRADGAQIPNGRIRRDVLAGIYPVGNTTSYRVLDVRRGD